MKIEQIYTGCLSEAAYYIQSDGEAAIIDPLRETEPYISRAEKDGVSIWIANGIAGIGVDGYADSLFNYYEKRWGKNPVGKNENCILIMGSMVHLGRL